MSTGAVGRRRARAGRSWVAFCLVGGLTVAIWGRPAAGCVGDCNGDGKVSINELVLGVSIALDTSPLALCRAFDENGDARVTVNELLHGVIDASSGCPIVATATPTATLTTVPTATPTGTPSSAEATCMIAPGDGVNFDPTKPFCDLLSTYRFFHGNGSTQDPNDGVLPYDVNTALFADYALKYRFVWMPPGTSATYDDRNAFAFPVGTVIVKTFAFPVDYRDLSLGQQLIETRLLARRATGWDVMTYLWNSAQTEATRWILGKTVPVSWIQADGTQGTDMYEVPNTNQCKECHAEHNDTVTPLGPKARNLNKDYAYADGTANQLTRWTAVGYLQGAPSPDQAPRAAVFDDPSTGDIDFRARTYLDTNCAHCHNSTGLASTSGLYLDIFETSAPVYGVCKPPVAAGPGAGDNKVDIFPGQPDASIIPYRMGSTKPGIAMPEIGRHLVHTEALELINAWIAQLPQEQPPLLACQ